MIVHAKVVGIKVAIPDPEKRKDILDSCHKGELLILERERNNPYDENAIAVKRISNELLGYVSAAEAQRLAQEIDEKQMQFDAVIEKISGGKSSWLGSILHKKEKPVEIEIVITKKYS